MKQRLAFSKSILLAFSLAALIFSRHPVQAQSKSVTVWTKFNDQNPQNTQDQWLADALKEYADTTAVTVNSVTQPYDQINSKLNIAVRAGGDVPDVSYVDSQQLGFFTQNGTLVDLTEWVKNASWYKDLTPSGLASCTAPDGKILCVPTSTATTFIYYWKDLYPNGFPTSIEKLLEAAKDLKAKDKFAITLKGSEKFSVETTYFGLIKSAGGEIADASGQAVWSSPQVAAAVKPVRELFTSKFAPEVALAPGFDDEEPFKRGDAAAFMAGSWSYVYLNPLTAPDGTKFDKGADSVAAAAAAGKLGFAPPLSIGDGKPASIALATGWAIPRGAKDIEAAKAFIDFQMTTARTTTFALAYGALPSLTSSLADKGFQTDYWKAVQEYTDKYAQPAAPLLQYDKGTTLLADALNRIMTDTSKDVAKELQAAQDEYNSGLK